MDNGIKRTGRFFLWIFLISWPLFWTAGILYQMHVISHVLMMVFVGLGSFTPSIGGLVMVRMERGKGGLRNYFKERLNFKLGWAYLPVLFFIPLCFLAAHGLNQFLQAVPFPVMESNPLVILVIFLVQLILTGSMGEEFGWSGYAIPNLLKETHWITTGLIVGSIWGLWHLPGFLFPGTNQQFMPFHQFILSTTVFSLLVSWLQSKKGCSLIPALIMHAMVNTIFELAPLVEMKPQGDFAPWIYFNLLLIVGVACIAIFDGLKKNRETKDEQE